MGPYVFGVGWPPEIPMIRSGCDRNIMFISKVYEVTLLAVLKWELGHQKGTNDRLVCLINQVNKDTPPKDFESVGTIQTSTTTIENYDGKHYALCVCETASYTLLYLL